MLTLTEVRLPFGSDEAALEKKIKKLLNISGKFDYEVVRHAIDPRKKPDIFYVYTVHVTLPEKTEEKLLEKKLPHLSKTKRVVYEALSVSLKSDIKIIIAGSGPAGMFAGLVLARAGLCPVIIERGQPVDIRKRDVEAFWEEGILNESSNVLFGEGGAGSFSDGKLETGIKDNNGYIRFILNTFAEFGAGGQILTDAKPHVGTDVLINVVKNIRHEIVRLGGRYIFGKAVSDIRISDGRISSVFLSDGSEMECSYLVTALGHSATDTLEMLYSRGVSMEQKGFAFGLRVEHPQSMIDEYTYGMMDKRFPPASYKLTYNGLRNVYSFCMCPGGYVVNSSAAKGMLTVNGMSYSDRGSGNANSAIVLAVKTGAFKGDDPFAGLRFLEELERNAFALSNGRIPQQLYGDFLQGEKSSSYGGFTSCHKGAGGFADLSGMFTEEMRSEFVSAMTHFGKIIKGFDREDTILSAIESRTSSPVRIKRDEALTSSVGGIYPAGEGAGYAGGITSAAADGVRVADRIIKNIRI